MGKRVLVRELSNNSVQSWAECTWQVCAPKVVLFAFQQLGELQDIQTGSDREKICECHARRRSRVGCTLQKFRLSRFRSGRRRARVNNRIESFQTVPRAVLKVRNAGHRKLSKPTKAAWGELGRKLMKGLVVGTGKRLDEVGRRLVTLLTRFLTSRDLQESKARLEEAQRVAHVGYWVWNLDTDCVTWSDETYRIFGLRPQESAIALAMVREMIHPEDRESVFRTAEEAILRGCTPTLNTDCFVRAGKCAPSKVSVL